MTCRSASGEPGTPRREPTLSPRSRTPPESLRSSRALTQPGEQVVGPATAPGKRDTDGQPVIFGGQRASVASPPAKNGPSGVIWVAWARMAAIFCGTWSPVDLNCDVLLVGEQR